MTDCTLTLTVSNHPGVLSRIAGLFARRNYNLDGVYVVGLTGTTESRMQLLVKQDERLPQIIKQLEKLYDVKAISVNEGSDMLGGCEVKEAG
ncbi:acetolactate synthase small subunit [Desulfoluna butyratoxydans]|uniref:Acetolactate synthase small subunit n=1 Tax=Desulfoluna butyratoxydans TaxID=231438 RepID=A0A4U8YNV6_9BACT|nr:acetolactate synthase small subunit [Desulfoluna butyratoxydans]VFQ45324.1 acetolactate synthase small subunit [Desulfoluna butyratoxydans]